MGWEWHHHCPSFHAFPMTHLSCKYSHLILISCTPWSLWTVFLIPIADWLHVLLLFPENSFNVSSLLHIQFTSSEELNYCDICLTNLTLPFPRHPFPSRLVYPKLKTLVSGCPCLLLPVLFPAIPHNFLHTKHLLDSSQAFPANPLPQTSLKSFWFHSFLQTLLPLKPIHRLGKRKWSDSPWLYLLLSTIRQHPFPRY